MSIVARVPLSDIAEVNPGLPPRRLRPDDVVSFIPMSDVSESGHWVTRQHRRLRDLGPGYTPFAEGDVLFAKITPCMENGKGIHAVGLESGVGFGSTEFHVLRARHPNDPRFIFHWLQTRVARQRALAYMGGSAGQQRVQPEFFTHFGIPAIPPVDQRRITAVLDTLDAAIAQTEAVIAKLKCVRAGLLHDLLTRGLDANGQLRPPPNEAPELYRHSPLGLIPRDWQVRTIDELLAPVDSALRSGPFGSALLKQELVPHGVPLLGIDNVHVERFARTYARFVHPAKFAELRRFAVRPGDVMVTIMGTVGRCCVVPSDIGDALSSKHVWTITLHPDRYPPGLLCWQVNYAPWVLAQLRRDEQGATMTAIRSQTIRDLRLPVPTAAEQEAAGFAMQDAACAVSAEEQFVHKLADLRSALAADLLTGRVRVPQVQQASAASPASRPWN